MTYFIEFLACLVRLPDRRVVSGKLLGVNPTILFEFVRLFALLYPILLENVADGRLRYRPIPLFRLIVLVRKIF